MLLAPRQPARRLLAPLQQAGKQGVHRGQALGHLGPGQDGSTDQQVVLDAELLENQAPLGHLPHAHAHQAMRGQADDGLAGIPHGTTGDLAMMQPKQTGDGPDQGGFAGAIGAQQGHDATLGH